MGQVIQLAPYLEARRDRREIGTIVQRLLDACCPDCGGDGITLDTRLGREDNLLECTACNGTGRLV
jgi:hypothetical protein